MTFIYEVFANVMTNFIFDIFDNRKRKKK